MYRLMLASCLLHVNFMRTCTRSLGSKHVHNRADQEREGNQQFSACRSYLIAWNTPGGSYGKSIGGRTLESPWHGDSANLGSRTAWTVSGGNHDGCA